jgi:hypothetical protein
MFVNVKINDLKKAFYVLIFRTLKVITFLRFLLILTSCKNQAENYPYAIG